MISDQQVRRFNDYTLDSKHRVKDIIRPGPDPDNIDDTLPYYLMEITQRAHSLKSKHRVISLTQNFNLILCV